MMKAIVGGIVAAGALIGASASASALPFGEPAAPPMVEQVRQGCGPGYYRSYRGFCAPFGYAKRRAARAGYPVYGGTRYYRRY